MEDPQKKYNLKEGPNDLKVYIHVVQQGIVFQSLIEDLRLTLAYSDMQAMETIKKDYPQNPVHIIAKKGELKIKDVIDKLNFTVPEIPQIVATAPDMAPVTKEKKLEDFINSTMLLADEYVKDEKDKSTIKKILGKIKLTEDGNKDAGKTEDQGSEKAAS